MTISIGSTPFTIDFNGNTFSSWTTGEGAGYTYDVIQWSLEMRVSDGTNNATVTIGDFYTIPGMRNGVESVDSTSRFTGPHLGLNGGITWTTTWFANGDVSISVVSDNALTITDLDPSIGDGLSIGWDGHGITPIPGEWNPAVKINAVLVDPADFELNYATSETSTDWFQSWNPVVPEADAGGAGGDLDSGTPLNGTTDSAALRCWGFRLDAHEYYVLRLGDGTTLVFDRSTRQWSRWQSPARLNWRPHVGLNWQGMTDSLTDGGTDIVCGDDATGVLYRLNPTKGTDDDPVTELAVPFSRDVTGMIALDGRDVLKLNAVQVTVAFGAPSATAAAISLETSSDLGKNWINHGSVSLTDADTVLEWRGCGLARQPGLLARLSDNGATVRIGRAEVR
jgi:hypothetical protein